MNEQIQTIIDRARELLADATPGALTVHPHPRPSGGSDDQSRFQWGDLVTGGRSMWTMIPMADAEALAFAVNNIGTLCEALVDAEAERDAMQQKLTRFNPGTGKAEPWDPDETLRGIRDHIPDDRRLDGFTLAGAVSEMAKLLAAAEVERDALRERAGIAEGREAAAKANAAEMAGWLSARNAGLVQMARDRDAALAQVECLKAQRDVARQDARRAENERDALRDESGPRITVAELQRESYETARAKGWHDEDETPPAPIRVIAWMGLICSEAAEAIEDARKGRMVTTIREDGKPEGLGSELADIVIRVCDSAGALGIDMDAELRAKLAFNRTRGHRHGGKLA